MNEENFNFSELDFLRRLSGQQLSSDKGAIVLEREHVNVNDGNKNASPNENASPNHDGCQLDGDVALCIDEGGNIARLFVDGDGHVLVADSAASTSAAADTIPREVHTARVPLRTACVVARAAGDVNHGELGGPRDEHESQLLTSSTSRSGWSTRKRKKRHAGRETELARRRMKDRERCANMSLHQRKAYNARCREMYHRQSEASLLKRRGRARTRYHGLPPDVAQQRNAKRAKLERQKNQRLTPAELEARNRRRRERAALLRQISITAKVSESSQLMQVQSICSGNPMGRSCKFSGDEGLAM